MSKWTLVVSHGYVFKYERKPLLEEMPSTLINKKVWILHQLIDEESDEWEYIGYFNTKAEMEKEYKLISGFQSLESSRGQAARAELDDTYAAFLAETGRV